MNRFKKITMGIIIGASVMGNSIISCYAATSSITADITETKVYGKFEYSEAGHQVKVTVWYQERRLSDGYTLTGSVSDVQNGNVTTAVASRDNPSGYKYVWGQAMGYVDGEIAAMTSPVTL